MRSLCIAPTFIIFVLKSFGRICNQRLSNFHLQKFRKTKQFAHQLAISELYFGIKYRFFFNVCIYALDNLSTISEFGKVSFLRPVLNHSVMIDSKSDIIPAVIGLRYQSVRYITCDFAYHLFAFVKQKVCSAITHLCLEV